MGQYDSSEEVGAFWIYPADGRRGEVNGDPSRRTRRVFDTRLPRLLFAPKIDHLPQEAPRPILVGRGGGSDEDVETAGGAAKRMIEPAGNTVTELTQENVGRANPNEPRATPDGCYPDARRRGIARPGMKLFPAGGRRGQMAGVQPAKRRKSQMAKTPLVLRATGPKLRQT